MIKTRVSEFSIFRIELLFTILIGWVSALLLVSNFKLGGVLIISLCTIIFVIIISNIIKNRTAFLFLLFFFPLLPFHLGYDPLTGILPAFRIHRILMALMLLFWLFKGTDLHKSIKSFPLTRPFLILFGSMFISSMFSSSKISSFFYLGTFLIEFYLFSVMIFDLMDEERIQDTLFMALVLSLALLSLLGIVEYLIGKNFYSFIKPFRTSLGYAVTPQIREGSFRIQGSMDHSISFGILISLGAILVMFLNYIEKKMFKKAFFITIYLCMGVVVFLTKSRSAILFFCVSNMIFFFLSKRKESLVIISLFSLFWVQPFFFLDTKHQLIFMLKSSFLPFSYGNREMFGSLESRLEMFHEISKAILKSPIIGYGNIHFGNYYIDNFYVSFLFSFGIIGLVALLFLMATIIYLTIVLLRTSKDERVKLFSAGVLSSIVGILLIWSTVALTSYFYLLWLYIGILMRMYVNQRTTFSRLSIQNT